MIEFLKQHPAVSATIITALVTLISGIISALVALIGHYWTLKRVREEMLTKFKGGLYDKQITAYQKFWDMLEPLSNYDVGHDPILLTGNDKFHFNAVSARNFFVSYRSFFYSEHGIFLSKRLRDEVIGFRSFSEEIIAENPNSGDVFPISNSKGRKIRHFIDGIHTLARTDIGLSDPSVPTEAIDDPNQD